MAHHQVLRRILLHLLLVKINRSAEIQFDNHLYLKHMLMELEPCILVLIKRLLTTVVPMVNIINNVPLVEEDCNSHGEFISQYQC
jgi:hypothetical protein